LTYRIIASSTFPQKRQNRSESVFSAPHFGQRLDGGLPHAAQNFLLVVLSVPHLVQRIALPGKPSDWPSLYHPGAGKGQQACGKGWCSESTRKSDRVTSHCLVKAVGDRPRLFRIAHGKVQEVTEYLDTELVTSAFGK
jgi:hypothetical protein